MTRLFMVCIVMLITLSPVLMYAQNIPVFWATDAKVLFNQASLNFRDASLRANRNLGEFGITAIVPDRLKLKYTVETGFSGQDDFTPSGSFMVGPTEFGQAQQGTGGQTQASGAQQVAAATPNANKPVTLDWIVKPTHRIEATCLALNRTTPNLYPRFVAQRSDINVTATSQEATAGQQQKNDNEGLGWWFCGIGAELIVPLPSARLSISIAGAKDTLFVDASYYERMGQWGAVSVGAKHEELKFNKGDTLRNRAIYLTWEVAL